LNLKLYTDEERQILLELPIWLIAGTAQVDKTGPVSFTMELKAGLEFMQAAVEPFQGNVLLQECFALAQGLTKDEMPTEKNLVSGDAVLEQVDVALSILGDDPDGPGYRAFLVALAQQVAHEAGEGMFGRGEKVSQEEASFILALKQRLGI
jgi:hypothetical protein